MSRETENITIWKVIVLDADFGGNKGHMVLTHMVLTRNLEDTTYDISPAHLGDPETCILCHPELVTDIAMVEEIQQGRTDIQLESIRSVYGDVDNMRGAVDYVVAAD